jgi:BirA family biotin operon repressor/biotin-[acetyl-CoA-carboxylase] ligase
MMGVNTGGDDLEIQRLKMQKRMKAPGNPEENMGPDEQEFHVRLYRVTKATGQEFLSKRRGPASGFGLFSKGGCDRLASMEDSDGAGLTGLWGGRVWRFDELPSTNTWAMDHAAMLQHGDVIWAVAQSAGRGRLDRTWLAAPGKCLTFSLVVAAPEFVPLAPNLGQLAAWAVRDTLLGLGVADIRLKWPNDVMVGEAKVAGLLVEQVPEPVLYVLGVGLNVNMTAADFAAAKLDRPAASIREAVGHDCDPRAVLKELLANMAARLDQARHEGTGPLWEMWARHDWLRGRSIRVTGMGRQIEGGYQGVDRDGRLRIRGADGREQALWSGDVERVREG